MKMPRLLERVELRLAALLGDDSHVGAVCLLSEGEIHAARNEWADFERINRRAADLRIAALGPRHPDTQAVFDRLGQYYRDRWHAQFQSGQWQAADATLERAIAAAIQQYGATRLARSQSPTRPAVRQAVRRAADARPATLARGRSARRGGRQVDPRISLCRRAGSS